ncbi:MAG TPA: bifunctional phosphoribosylaminoimidazolecarboxamide formyltransferase/IMP cyclohydrolase, partial [Methylocystis sp.]|nr:bifunctional phosphoribosylaminoimidazolecarboxamide formyltransferase/IMP cyclohydrolase [Methylocystis sp.]
MPVDRRSVCRALLSVSDKSGIVEFARALAARGVTLISTGGTHKALTDAGLSVRDVADVTQFPEMMDGRVKTLHPRIHGGLLAVRENPEHEAAIERGASFEDCIENIDIGGPAMIRAACKNHESVAVIVDPSDYATLLAELEANNGATTLALRRRLAQKAFARTAAYDAEISNWLAEEIG